MTVKIDLPRGFIALDCIKCGTSGVVHESVLRMTAAIHKKEPWQICYKCRKHEIEMALEEET